LFHFVNIIVIKDGVRRMTLEIGCGRALTLWLSLSSPLFFSTHSHTSRVYLCGFYLPIIGIADLASCALNLAAPSLTTS